MNLHSVLLARWVGESPFVRVLHCYMEQASGLVTREPEPLFVQLGLWNLPHFKQFENGRFDVEIAEKCTRILATVILPHVDRHWRCPCFLILQQCWGTARNLFVLCTKDIR